MASGGNFDNLAQRLDGQDFCLLQLVLASGAKRDDAWTRWSALANFDILDTGCLLVPAAYCRCSQTPGSSAVTDRMKGAFSKNWLITRLMQGKANPFLDKLAASGTACALGDDLALALHYYSAPAARPVYELAIYAARPEAELIAALAKAEGFAPKARGAWQLTEQVILRVRHMSAARIASGSLKVESSALPVLDPARQFYASFNAARPQLLLRIQDMGVILRGHGHAIDWQWLVSNIANDGRLDDLRTLLAFYSNDAGMELPAGARQLPDVSAGGMIAGMRRLVRKVRV